MRRSLTLLVVALLLVGCSKSDPAPEEVTRSEPPPTITRKGSHPFLPDRDYIYSANRLTRGDQGALTEQWLREEGRLIFAEDGRPVRQWAIGETGVWAPDPHNPAIMLRLLPAEPKDGLVWHQESDGQRVWFRLRQTAAGGNDRWLLTMLNRGARFDYEFDPQNFSFNRREAEVIIMGAAMSQPIDPGQRAIILALAPPLPTRLAEVITADQAAFAAALTALPGQARVEVDVDGDGRLEQIVGALGQWSGSPIDLLAADGAHLRTIGLGGISRVEPFMVGREPRLLIDEGGTLHLRWFGAHGEEAALAMGPDLFRTPATSYRQLEDGLLEVTWEPGDAAGHRRIRTLRIEPGGGVTLEAERWEAVDGALRPATTARAALEGLLFTRWYGRPDSEALRYLANPSDLSLIKGLRPVRQNLGPEVSFGLIPKGGFDCQFERAGEPIPEGWGAPSGFGIIESYPGGETDVTLGRASFGRAPDGRVVIEQLEILRSCHSAH